MHDSRTEDSRRDAPPPGSADAIHAVPPGETADNPRPHRLAQLAQMAEAPLVEGRRFGGWPGLPGVLVAGLKGLVMFPIRPGAIPARAIWSILLAIAIIAMAIVGDALLLGEEAVAFNWLTLRTSTVDLAILALASVWLAEPRESPPVPVPTGGMPLGAAPAAPLMGVRREPPPPLHFATTVLSASFWTVLAGYAITIALDRQAETDEMAWLPGIGFYTVLMLWPWWVAIRTIQYQHRYQPIPWWRRVAVILAMLAALVWSMVDPGEPFWIYSEPLAPELLYTFAAIVPET